MEQMSSHFIVSRALVAAPTIGNVSWRHGTVGRTLARKVRKVLESSQKKFGSCRSVALHGTTNLKELCLFH